LTDNGFIKLHRALLGHPVWTQLSPTVLKVWIGCLLRANWKPSTWYDGKQQVYLPAGSFIFSQATLGKFCCLSRKQVRTALKHLQKLHCIHLKLASTGAKRYSLLVIENWTTYQSEETHRGQHRGHEGAIEEEVKNKPSLRVVPKTNYVTEESLAEARRQRIARFEAEHPELLQAEHSA